MFDWLIKALGGVTRKEHDRDFQQIWGKIEGKETAVEKDLKEIVRKLPKPASGSKAEGQKLIAAGLKKAKKK